MLWGLGLFSFLFFFSNGNSVKSPVCSFFFCFVGRGGGQASTEDSIQPQFCVVWLMAGLSSLTWPDSD